MRSTFSWPVKSEILKLPRLSMRPTSSWPVKSETLKLPRSLIRAMVRLPPEARQRDVGLVQVAVLDSTLGNLVRLERAIRRDGEPGDRVVIRVANIEMVDRVEAGSRRPAASAAWPTAATS